MKKRPSSGGSNWMDTYGDMVTLLLCFFVLLFAMSTMDKEKMMQIVQAFNPDQIVQTDPGSGNSGIDPNPMEGMTQDEIEQAMQQLLQNLQSYAKSESAAGEGQQPNIAVTKGDGYIYVSFNDAVFFGPNSYELLETGKVVLNDISNILIDGLDAIDEVRVLGHTAQETPDRPNNATVDRILSSNRANVVLVYVQEQSGLDPARMVSMGYGQNRPVASNDSQEERAKNRRVEMIISGIDTMSPEGDVISQYYTDRGLDNPNPSPAAAAPTVATPAPVVAAP